MHILDAAYADGAEHALLKFGATRAHKEVWKSMRAGDMDRASRLSKTPNVFTDSPRAQLLGHELKSLGRGGEGLATAVAHPTHGAAVRKTFDESAGVYSPTIVKRKEQLGNVEGAAKFLGAAQTQHGTPMHFNEFVPGRQITRKMMQDPAFVQKFEQAKAVTQASGRQKGRELHDLRPANAMQTPQGDVKFVDTMPFNRNEVMHPSVEKAHRASGRMPENMLPLNHAGAALLPNMGDNRNGTSDKQFKQHMFSDKPAGVPSANFASLNTMAPSPTGVPAPLGPQTSLAPPAWREPPPLWSTNPSSIPPQLTTAATPGKVSPTQNPMVGAPTAVSSPRPGPTVSLRKPNP